MLYGIYKNQKINAEPNKTANCPCCNEVLIPKCGKLKVWHWAHKQKEHCDTWHENETQWHKDWKNYFPKEYQEVVMFDETTGEKHIADVCLPNGLVLEFQNSSISADEIQAREKFYKKMIWVLNADKFKNSISNVYRKKFRWERFRTAWSYAKMPIFLDFPNGGPIKHWIDEYLDTKISKEYDESEDNENFISANCQSVWNIPGPVIPGKIYYESLIDSLLWFKKHIDYQKQCNHYGSTGTKCIYCGKEFQNCTGVWVGKTRFIEKYQSYIYA